MNQGGWRVRTEKCVGPRALRPCRLWEEAAVSLRAMGRHWGVPRKEAV